MSSSSWWRLAVVACALAYGCDEGNPAARSSLEQAARADRGSFDGWAAIDDGTGNPIELRELDDEDYIVHGPDTAVPLPPADGGIIEDGPSDPLAGDPKPQDPGVPDAGVPDAPVPVPDASIEEPDVGGGIDLGLCDLLQGLLCADGLECIDGVCTEPLACAPGEDCEIACSHASRCAADCEGANTCEVDCGDSTGCAVSCAGANNCEPKCRGGGHCEIDCRDANNCDHVVCDGDAQCIVHCGEDTNCKLEKCREPRRCSGNILVCNRACPPGSEEEGEEKEDD